MMKTLVSLIALGALLATPVSAGIFPKKKDPLGRSELSGHLCRRDRAGEARGSPNGSIFQASSWLCLAGQRRSRGFGRRYPDHPAGRAHRRQQEHEREYRSLGQCRRSRRRQRACSASCSAPATSRRGSAQTLQGQGRRRPVQCARRARSPSPSPRSIPTATCWCGARRR